MGNQSEKLVELVEGGKNVVIVLNSRDHKGEKRNEYLADETKAFNELGFNVEELDLRKFFGKEKELEEFLRKKDLVWVDGGNTFLLRRAMKKSGFDNVIKKLLKEDSITYGGFSAGVVVLQQSLHSLDMVDNPNNISEGYESEIVWEGLGLLDFNVAVHYRSDHPESALVEKEVEYCKNNNIPYKTLSDGEVIIINGDDLKILK